MHASGGQKRADANRSGAYAALEGARESGVEAKKQKKDPATFRAVISTVSSVQTRDVVE